MTEKHHHTLHSIALRGFGCTEFMQFVTLRLFLHTLFLAFRTLPIPLIPKQSRHGIHQKKYSVS